VDERKKENIETRNRAKVAIYRMEKVMEEMNGRISEGEKRALKETLGKLKAALNDSNVQKIKDYTDALLEHVNGLTRKMKMVSQAKTLMCSIEKRLDNKTFSEERRKIREAVRRLEEAPYKGVGKEMNRLKEMITLLEADHTT
jgi:hypothetical protein